MKKTWWRKSKGWIITLFIFFGFIVLLNSCGRFKFRSSQKEINKFFTDKPNKGTFHSYYQGKRFMNYLEVGDTIRPLVLFIHGSPGALDAFLNFLADTTLLNRAQLASVDRPGFGDSNFGYAEPSLHKQAELIKPILEKHKKQRPLILVGHSLGGPVIARIAMDYPELVDGLIFVAGSIDPELEPHEWFRAPLATPFLSWMLPRAIRASNDEIYKLKPELQEMLPLWPTIKAPVIFIQGGIDELVDPRNADFAKKMMTGTEVKLVLKSDMNHFVPWSNPELIRNAIVDMLNTIDSMQSSSH
jgi:pimeloyl-ACP methyl ester carboxylesterase